DLVPLSEIVPTLRPLLQRFKEERRPEESFGDYCQRQGTDRLQSLIPQQAKVGPKAHVAAKHTNGDAALAVNGRNGASSPMNEVISETAVKGPPPLPEA